MAGGDSSGQGYMQKVMLSRDERVVLLEYLGIQSIYVPATCLINAASLFLQEPDPLNPPPC